MKNPLLLLLLLVVAAAAVGDYFMPYGPYVSAPEWSAEPATYRAVVTQPAVQRGKTQRMVVRLADADARVMLTIADTSANVLPGDAIIFHTTISEPHNAGNPGEMDYAAYLRHQGITGTAFCFTADWRTLGPSPHASLRERMLLLRQRLVDTYATHLDAPTLAIISAMTLGDKARIDTSTRDLYSRTGSSHILALSGLHLSILVGLLAFILTPLRQRFGFKGNVAAHALTLLLVWAFVFLAGLPVSLIRAATMLTIVIVLHSLHHPAPPFHALIVALIIMLIAQPTQLFDVGFQLSALSVAAIIGVTRLGENHNALSAALDARRLRLYPLRLRLESLCMRLFSRRLRSLPVTHGIVVSTRAFVRWAGMLLVISLAAQIATLPLIAHYFHTASLTGLLSAWIVIPAATMLLIASLIFLIIPPLRPLIAVALQWAVATVHSLLESIAALPFAAFEVHLSWWGVIGSYAVIATLVWAVAQQFSAKTSGRRVRAVALVVGVALIAGGGEQLTAWMQRPAPQIIVYNRPAHMELHLTAPTSDSLITTLADDGRHVTGHVVAYGTRRIAVIDRRLPYVANITMPTPLSVDALLITRGAKGHLADMLLRYRPALIVLDGSLTDYYRQRFAEEAATEGLPIYDVQAHGAYVLRVDRR